MVTIGEIRREFGGRLPPGLRYLEDLGVSTDPKSGQQIRQPIDHLSIPKGLESTLNFSRICRDMMQKVLSQPYDEQTGTPLHILREVAAREYGLVS